MSRLTPKWTETLDEAFGDTGTKGRLGEEFLEKVFQCWGWSVELFKEDRSKQVRGIDLQFKKPSWSNFYTGDVKNNMDKYGNFYVHKDWLFKIECDRVFHVNPDTGWVVWYGVDEMQKVYDNSKTYMKFTARTRLPFMKATKVDLNAE